MIVDFKVYRKAGDRIPVISLSELPNYQFMGKPKFTGKKAKIEAVFRLTGERLPSDWKRQDVEDYIAKNIFKTPEWGAYYKLFKEISNEREAVVNKLEFQYVLRVELKDSVNLPSEEEKLVYLLIQELIGEPQKEYKGLINPILKLSKHY